MPFVLPFVTYSVVSLEEVLAFSFVVKAIIMRPAGFVNTFLQINFNYLQISVKTWNYQNFRRAGCIDKTIPLLVSWFYSKTEFGSSCQNVFGVNSYDTGDKL